MPKFNMYQSLHTTVIGPRASRSSCRSAPSRCTAARSTASPRTGSTRRTCAPAPTPTAPLRRRRRRQRHGLAAPAARLAAGDRGPGRVPRVAALRDQLRRGLRLHPARRRDRAAGRVDAGRLRLRRPHRGRPPQHRRPGQRPAGAAGVARSTTATSSRSSPPRRRAPGPSRDWLGFVKSPRARNKIRQWFTKERREEAIEQGKEQIARLMRKEGLPLQRVLTHETLTTVATELRLADVSALYAAVGEGNVGAQTVVRRVMDLFGGEEGATEDLAEGVQITGRAVAGPAVAAATPASSSRASTDVWVKLAKCCTPVPGDDDPRLRHPRRGRLGAPRRLHQRRRPDRRSPERIVEVEWAPTAQSVFLVAIQVEALDRARLLSDITRVLSDLHVNILSASLTHRPRPGRQEPVHLRDGRPEAPRPRAARRPPRRRRLRRLPRHPVATRAVGPRSRRGRLSGGGWSTPSSGCVAARRGPRRRAAR